MAAAQNRPVLNLPVTPLERVLDLGTLLLVISGWALVAFYYNSLPPTIPTHFNIHGTADGSGDRSFLLILPFLTTVTAVGIFLLTRIPHRYNYLVKITPENAEFEYRKARILLRTVSFLTAFILTYVVWQIVSVAQGGEATLGTVFSLAVLLVTLLPLGILVLWKQKRIKL